MGAAKRALDTEMPFAKYVGERIDLLELQITIADLDEATNALARRKGHLLNYRNALFAAGGSLLAIGIGITSTGGTQSFTSLMPAVLASFGLALPILWSGFRALKWSKYLYWNGFVRVEFEYADELASILEKVSDSSGNHRIMRIAASGVMQTPATFQPSDWVIGAGAIEDRFIALSLFGAQAGQTALIAIVPEPTGRWQDYYFWHPPIRERLDELWAKSVSKYRDVPVDHYKVSVGLKVLAGFVSSGGIDTVPRGELEKTLTKLLILALNHEANRLAASGEITLLEAAEMKEVALKVERGGEVEARATTTGIKRRSSGSDSWFRRLRKADYSAICSPLQATIKAELGIDPGYVERKTPIIVEHSEPIQPRMC
jgi:hypothetical protein